ncbi:hydrocephalus-inducing protein-like [Lathamus discolor]|uniref:hydrocephalus-inducing protein-like n=1 Tax=Lathamus discolor TaxID=678569 RepID=UPI0032B7DFB4
MKVDKHLPASEHDKLREEMRPAPCVFEVLPSAGTLAPGQQCHVQVRFSPTEEKCYRGELQIQICQSSQRLRVPVLGCGLEPRLELSPAELELGPLLPQSHGEEGTVVGSLVSLDQDQLSFGAVVWQSYTCRRVVMRNAGDAGTLTFSCNVREKQSQTILLSNPSSEAWTLQPIVEGKYWKGPEFIHLEARQKEKAYQVTYRPLTMSCGNKKHQGSIFFPLPDGTGLRYQLEGTAEAPRCSGAISRQVACRNSHTELIPVSNWLQIPQRFLVVIDMLKPENLESSSVLQGCSYIDVPSSAKKDYQLTFFSYKEGVYRAKVTFLNETTGEYLFHMVTFKVMASGPIGTVEMSTAVRQRVSSTVKVDNPLPVPVTFAINCKVPDVSQPLKTGESTGHLVLQSSDLGSLSYNLQLKATSSRPEKPVYFRTTLGSRQTITTKIRNFAQQETEYLLQTDCADFRTAKSISAAPASAGGSELNVEVTFEPCHLGKAKATLQVSSALGGQYCIPLIGLALPPEPQGPFLIPAGGTTSISFRNVFPRATAFQYAVKHPAFSVRAPEMLRAKSSTTITVSFTGGPAPVTSRLATSATWPVARPPGP